MIRNFLRALLCALIISAGISPAYAASNLKVAYASANAEASSLGALANSGTLVIYSGSQPATPETALSGNTALVTFNFSTTAFGTPSNGTITASFTSTSPTIASSGTAAWYRVYKSDGTTAVWDGSVCTSGCDINLNSVALSSGASLTLSSLTFTVPGN